MFLLQNINEIHSIYIRHIRHPYNRKRNHWAVTSVQDKRSSGLVNLIIHIKIKKNNLYNSLLNHIINVYLETFMCKECISPYNLRLFHDIIKSIVITYYGSSLHKGLVFVL
jgi:hypothetical protein